MAKTTAPVKPPRDPLRDALDRLAAKLVKTAMEDTDATVRTLSDALKTAGAYYHASRKAEGGSAPDLEGSAWAEMQSSFMAEGTNGKTH